MKKKSPSFLVDEEDQMLAMNRAARVKRLSSGKKVRDRPYLMPIRRSGTDEDGKTIYERDGERYVPYSS